MIKGNLCSTHFVTYTLNFIILHIFSPSETLSTGWEKYQNDSQEESVTEVKVDTSELPLVTSSNGEQVLRFYWLDAYEDPYSSPGTFTVEVWNQENFVDILSYEVGESSMYLKFRRCIVESIFLCIIIFQALFTYLERFG